MRSAITQTSGSGEHDGIDRVVEIYIPRYVSD
jgi:hypothetical protein